MEVRFVAEELYLVLAKGELSVLETTDSALSLLLFCLELAKGALSVLETTDPALLLFCLELA